MVLEINRQNNEIQENFELLMNFISFLGSDA